MEDYNAEGKQVINECCDSHRTDNGLIGDWLKASNKLVNEYGGDQQIVVALIKEFGLNHRTRQIQAGKVQNIKTINKGR